MTQDSKKAKVPNPNRKVKDTVFTDLFKRKEYLIQLYKAIHPEDTGIQEEELSDVTLTHVLVDKEYNDLGFTVKDKFIVLVEAQSTWSPNIVIRCLFYLAQTIHDYATVHNLNLYSSTKVEIPKPEIYVIYTGDEKHNKEYLSIKEDYFDGASNFLEVKAKILYNGDEGDIIYQYITFCKVFDQQKELKKTIKDLNPIEETIRICKDKNILREYLIEHEKEVKNIMVQLYTQEEALNLYIEEKEAKAIAEGEAKGIAIGEAKAKAESEARFVLFKLSKGMTAQEISQDLGLDLERVEEIIAESKKTA